MQKECKPHTQWHCGEYNYVHCGELTPFGDYKSVKNVGCEILHQAVPERGWTIYFSLMYDDTKWLLDAINMNPSSILNFMVWGWTFNPKCHKEFIHTPWYI